MRDNTRTGEANQFYCISKYLAEQLACNGHTGTRVHNIYDPSKPAWTFELNPESARLIADHFTSRDKGVPIPVQRYLASLTDPEGV